MLLTAPWREDEVFLNDEANRGTGTDGDRWLDVECLRSQLIAGMRNILLSGLADGLDETALPRELKLGSDTE